MTSGARNLAAGVGWGVVAALATFALAVISVVQAIWWVLVLCLLGFWLL